MSVGVGSAVSARRGAERRARVGFEGITLRGELLEPSLVAGQAARARVLERERGPMGPQLAQPREGLSVLRAQAPVDGVGDAGRLLDGAALEEEGGPERQASHVRVVRVRAQQRIEALLVGAQVLEEAGQARLGEVERLLAQAQLGRGEGAREQRHGLREVTLGQPQPGEAVDQSGDRGMVLAEDRF